MAALQTYFKTDYFGGILFLKHTDLYDFILFIQFS